MLGAIGLYSAAIPKVIEHIGFKVQTEWLEYFVLHTDTQVHRQLITWLDVASQRERRVGRNDILFIKRTVDRHFKCHTSRRICVKASLAPYTIGQAQWHANIIYLLGFYKLRLVVFTCKFRLQPRVGQSRAENPIRTQLLVEGYSQGLRTIVVRFLVQHGVSIRCIVLGYPFHFCPLHGIHQCLVSR